MERAKRGPGTVVPPAGCHPPHSAFAVSWLLPHPISYVEGPLDRSMDRSCAVRVPRRVC